MRSLGVLEFTEYIAPDGSVYPFDTLDRFILSEEGLGMPPIEYITQKGPYQHGATLVDFRLQPRTIQLVMRQDSCNRADYWSNRAALLNALRPNKFIGFNYGPGVLRKKFEDGSIRDIKVTIEQGPIFSARSLDRWDEYGYTETIRFIAHDPIFYDPTETVVAWGNDELTELVFPITFPISFDSSSILNAKSIVNSGTWMVFPTIAITGPLYDVEIVNLSTGEKIGLERDIQAGEIVTVTLEYGNKTVYNNLGENLIGTISVDSDLATFHLACDPEVSGGINTVRAIGVGNTEDSSVVITYNNRYIGI